MSFIRLETSRISFVQGLKLKIRPSTPTQSSRIVKRRKPFFSQLIDYDREMPVRSQGTQMQWLD